MTSIFVLFLDVDKELTCLMKGGNNSRKCLAHTKEFINASDFIESSPDPAFTKIVRAGFELWYQTCHPEGERHLYIKATLSGDYIGEADFTEEDDNTTAL